MKKITVFIISLLLVLFLSSCQLSDNPTPSETEDNSQSNGLSEFEEAFFSILNSNRSFYSASRKENILISDYQRKIWQYATVDLDSDEKDEFVVMFNDGSILIIKSDKDSEIGFDFGLHAMYQINTDGSFNWNADSGNTYGCSRLQFSGNECTTVELWRVEHDGSDSVAYYVDDTLVSESEFQIASEQFSSESIVWIKLETDALASYTEFLKGEGQGISYAYKDIDGDGEQELIVDRALVLSFYDYDTEVKKIYEYDFQTGTTRFLNSGDDNYPGIITFNSGGGTEWYKYMSFKDGVVSYDVLLEDRYHLGEDDERVVVHSDDQVLVELAKQAVESGTDIEFLSIK